MTTYPPLAYLDNATVARARVSKGLYSCKTKRPVWANDADIETKTRSSMPSMMRIHLTLSIHDDVWSPPPLSFLAEQH